MKPSAILTADIHLREDTPVARLDDYFTAQERKIKFIRSLQKKYDIPVLDSGDLFHRWKPSPFLLQWAIKNLPDMITVEGNHDQSAHNAALYEKTGLAVLEAAGVVQVPIKPIELNGFDLHVFPWGAELYGVNPSRGKQRQIALAHLMTYTGRKPYPGCTDPGATSILNKLTGFDLIVTGHNHKPFTLEQEGRLLVNPGSMMRSTADQADYKPCVWLWFAEDNHVEQIFLPIEEGVVSREHIEVIENREERMEAFVSRLRHDVEIGLSFEQNLERWLSKNRVRTRTKEILSEVLR